MNYESEYYFERNTQVFTPEQIRLANSVRVDKSDFDVITATMAEDDKPQAIKSRSRLAWNGLTRCYWYSLHKDPLGPSQRTPTLPNNPLIFEGISEGLKDSDSWRLNLGSLMEFLNSYYAFKSQHPDLIQTEILGRHMWPVSLDNLNDLCIELYEALCEFNQTDKF